MSLRKTTFLALFTTISMAVFAIESAIPPILPIPGVKLGLANIVTLILLMFFSWKEALMVLFCRILLSSLLFGQAMSLMYSLAGGLISLLIMTLVMKLLRGKTIFLTGAMGGLAHNAAQLSVAYFLTSTPGVFAYLPYLVLAGILTGLFTGLCASFLERYLRRLLTRK